MYYFDLNHLNWIILRVTPLLERYNGPKSLYLSNVAIFDHSDVKGRVLPLYYIDLNGLNGIILRVIPLLERCYGLIV